MRQETKEAIKTAEERGFRSINWELCIRNILNPEENPTVKEHCLRLLGNHVGWQDMTYGERWAESLLQRLSRGDSEDEAIRVANNLWGEYAPLASVRREKWLTFLRHKNLNATTMQREKDTRAAYLDIGGMDAIIEVLKSL